MCGLVGFLAKTCYDTVSADLPRAVSALRHRGPDDAGLFFDPSAGVGLGHRRLSIIDPSTAGRQPMASEDGKIQLIYNGEVYNFRELRKELQSKGHRFGSRTDSEVVLRSYMEWGSEALHRFTGMFSLAVWDGRKRRLFLARDRLGIKPLYYFYHEGLLLFASELKGLMAFGDFQRAVDPEALAQYLHYQYVPCPWTIFKNTRKLEPGHYLLCGDGEPSPRTYWRLPRGDPGGGGGVEKGETELRCLERFEQILSRAVSDRLVSDVPLGALLSGGIDSSLVVSFMCRESSTPVRTFSIGFGDAAYDEAPYAARVARHLGTEHTELYVSPTEALEIIPRLPEIYDEPFADSSAVPTCLVSRLTRSLVTVALSGDGGDEQFGGYARYWATGALANRLERVPRFFVQGLSRVLRRFPARWAEEIYGRLRGFVPSVLRVENFPDKWEKAIRQLGREGLESLYRATITLWDADEIMGILGRKPASGRFERLFSETETLPVISRLMRVDQLTYLPDAMLTKVDRASMACGLEVRVPLLDHRVVEFAAGIPEDLKVRDGRGKYLLRKLLARFVPPKLFDRTKMGFALPLEPWLRTDLKPLLRDYLSAERLEKEGLFDTRPVHRMLREHFSGRANHHHRLWALLVWEMWRERWLT